MSRLFLIHHGTNDIWKNGFLAGWMPDDHLKREVCLNDTGRLPPVARGG